MRISWRAAASGLAGLVGAVTWAISSAVYQPIMEPTGGWFADPGGTVSPFATETVQQTASNNTYWPRDLRQLAILLAVAGIVVLCRASSRAVVTATAAGIGWLTADVLLDRADVHGAGAAIGLGAAAVVYVAAVAFAAVRLSRADSGGPALRHVIAGSLVMLAAISLEVVTPWVEQTTPEEVRVEAELTALKVTASVLFSVLAALTVGPPATRRAVVLGAALVAAAAGALVVVGELRDEWSPIFPFDVLIGVVAGMVAVAAPRVRGVAGLVGVAVASTVGAFGSFVVLIFGGMAVGNLLTRLADNPPVNGADTDLSLPLLVPVLGIAMSLLTLAVTALPDAWRAVQDGRPASTATAG